MRLPTQRDRIVLGRSDQQVRLHLTTAAMHDRLFRIGPSLGRRAGEQTVPGQQVIDITGHLHPAPRQQDEVVGDPFELDQHVRRQQH